LPDVWSQITQTWTSDARTLRGMHFQVAPFAETKLVTCVGGAIYDVVIDLRKPVGQQAPWCAFDLRDGDYSILIPPGCAHGYLSLTDNVSVIYHINRPYSPNSARRILWNDPDVAVDWPFAPKIISDDDRNAPTLNSLRSKEDFGF